MEKLGLNEIREKYLSFFESKGHLRLPSFPLIPQGDSSLLLINAGMAPLKPYFTGEAEPPRHRVTTCQKCIRTPDIERVGKTSRHGTFFEMLGNFSFGDYFKNEATAWAWEFITKVLEIPEDKLYVSVYEQDQEAYDIWTQKVGVSPDHMVFLGKEDNFWEIGAGPCGPCSEIYFDRGEEHGCHSPDCHVGCDCDRYVEFWNLVFTQFNNDGNGNYTPLAKKNIDTGMGLERMACIMQGVDSLFDVDTVMNITHKVSELTGATYGQSTKTDVSLRVITDHIRSTTMLIGDGVLPSNEGRGYVLRRLLRRAARHGKLLGKEEPFLYLVADTVIKESEAAYPELREKRDYIVRVIKAEEERFDLTIDSGMRILGGMIDDCKASGKTVLDGADCFKLYDTYGFPIDLTLEILAENGLDADRDGFDKLMNEQRERARAATAALGDFGWAAIDLGLPKNEQTEFTGYEVFENDDARVLAIVSDGELCSEVREGDEAVIVLDKTPFYAEMGGQCADVGDIEKDGALFRVTDVHKSKDGKYMHSGAVLKGSFSVDDTVKAEIDADRRRAIMRAHSATHLLDAALKEVLGSHIEQAGSLVTPDTVRFDFTHFAAVTPEEIEKIEELVNEKILEDLAVDIREMPIDEAKKSGAVALFGEKYGDIVRVVSMGDFSKEFCGGTHLANTAKVGLFRIVAEYSVAAGVRRIDAVTGMKAREYLRDTVAVNRTIAEMLKTSPGELVAKVGQNQNEQRELRRAIEKLRTKLIQQETNSFLLSSKDVKGVKLITAVLEDADGDALRSAGDYLKSKAEDIVAVLASVNDGKISFIAVCGKGAVARGVKAGDIIKNVTKIAGGSGGGKPDVAMGGGKDVMKVDDALAAVDEIVGAMIK
ncbi:MAG: alanine--tRNA ligase [Oscillospiraceae bacterium]|nr:alanine--tRNA ligase [Oscillospiraceae bacterium]